MANSVDQIRLLLQEQSHLGLHYLHAYVIFSDSLVFEILGSLLYYKIHCFMRLAVKALARLLGCSCCLGIAVEAFFFCDIAQ